VGPMCLAAWPTGRSGPRVFEGVAGPGAHLTSASAHFFLRPKCVCLCKGVLGGPPASVISMCASAWHPVSPAYHHHPSAPP
jgi:hypothetical protein